MGPIFTLRSHFIFEYVKKCIFFKSYRQRLQSDEILFPQLCFVLGALFQTARFMY